MSDDHLWWRDGVIYQIYPRSFADSNGDGIGDLPGIISRLDHLNGAPDSLGVDAIWLSPIYPSPMYDFGYDVADYENIDPTFGTLEDFDRLVAEAHKRGIRVVMDLVLNHSSHLHPWFIESRASRNHPKREWYLWRDPARGGRPPNNWQAVFGGSGWEWDERTDQYYYHMFLKEQPDFNWRNPEIRARIFQAVKFWLDRGVDGFRLDVVNAFFKDDRFRDNPPASGQRAYDRQKHIYDLNRPELIGVYQELRRLLDSYPERMSVGEVMARDPDVVARYCGPDRLHLAFDFYLTHRPWKPRAFQEALARNVSALGENQPCYALSNHDVARHTTRYGGGAHSEARAKVAAMFLLTIRCTPFIYYGEEIGMQNTPIPRAEVQDPQGKRYPTRGRDPERTPMQWNAEANAGFTTGKPWLRLNKDYRARNVAAQQPDPNSVLNFYKQIIRFRRESAALRRGSYESVFRRPVNVLAYLRRAPEQTTLVALNFFARKAAVKMNEPLPSKRWRLRLTSVPGEHTRLKAGQLTLAPFEACIFEAE